MPLDGLAQILDEAIRHAAVLGAQHQVEGVRRRLPVEVPAAIVHDVADGADVELVRGKGENAHHRISDHAESLGRVDRRCGSSWWWRGDLRPAAGTRPRPGSA